MKKFLLLFLLLFCLSGCAPAAQPAATFTPTPAVSAVAPTPSTQPMEPLSVSGTLAVHFIDVGQADSALVLCGGEAMLIDGGNVADSSLVVSYLKNQGVERLDYLVCTHAHEDHAGGLSGPLNTCTVGKVYAPVTEYDSKAFRDFAKYVAAQGLSITIPVADESFMLGGAKVQILGPRRDDQETNDTSIVLRVDFGNTSFLFTGDAEREAEQDLLNAECNLSATVLKVGHHGSETSTGYQFLREIMPEYAVISVGTGNSYGHPTDAVLSRLRDAEVEIYRTDMQGTIVAVSDGSTVTFTTKKNAATSTNPTQTDNQNAVQSIESVAYIGNINSHKFHLPTCGSLPAEKNRVPLDSYVDAIAQGFSPCGNCLGEHSATP